MSPARKSTLDELLGVHGISQLHLTYIYQNVSRSTLGNISLDLSLDIFRLNRVRNATASSYVSKQCNFVDQKCTLFAYTMNRAMRQAAQHNFITTRSAIGRSGFCPAAKAKDSRMSSGGSKSASLRREIHNSFLIWLDDTCRAQRFAAVVRNGRII